MLNKALLLLSSPPSDKDIFVLTIGSSPSQSHCGFADKNASEFWFGFSTYGSLEPIVPTTGVMSAQGAVLPLPIHGLAFSLDRGVLNVGLEFDRPTESAKGHEVYCHIKVDTKIYSVAIPFLGGSVGLYAGPETMIYSALKQLIGQTVRVYLGPSPTPPPYL